MILAILRDQGEECERLAGVLYTKGLTQRQVGDVLIRYTGGITLRSTISRMVECVRTQVNEWLERGLEEYFPVVCVDCVHIKIHRKRSVVAEAFYVGLLLKKREHARFLVFSTCRRKKLPPVVIYLIE